MNVKYTVDEAREFLSVAYANCIASSPNLSFAIFSAYKAQIIFSEHNLTSLIEESEAIIKLAREKIRQSYKAKLFNEISEIQDYTQRKMMDQYFHILVDETLPEYMEEKMWRDERFDTLVKFCLGDTSSDLEAGLRAYELFLGKRNAA